MKLLVLSRVHQQAPELLKSREKKHISLVELFFDSYKKKKKVGRSHAEEAPRALRTL